MHGPRHRGRAPGRWGRLIASSIHRSVYFFRYFEVTHPPLRSAHPSLLRRRKNLGLHLWTTYWTIHFICFDRSVGRRGVAQLGSAPASGAGGRKFKSSRPDYFKWWVGHSVWGGLEAVMCGLFRECLDWDSAGVYC